MSDLFHVLMALTVVIVPLWLAWALVGWREHRKKSPAAGRRRGPR
jgi:hypothetical protein